MDSAGSSGIGCFTNLPLIKGLLKNPGISRTGEWLISTYSAAQSMRARTSMAAASTPDPKNRNEWISGWCSSGRIWCWRSSKYSMGLSTIFLYFFSCSLWAISLAPMLSSLCFEDLGLGLWLDFRSERPEPLSTLPECGLLWGHGTVSGTISPWPIIFGGVIISAPGSRAQAFPIFRFRHVQADRIYDGL